MRYFIIISLFFTSLLGIDVQAAEDLYPCSLEMKRPLAGPAESGSFYARVYVEDRFADSSSPLKFRWITLVAPKTGEWSGLFSEVEEFRYTIQSIQFSSSLESLGISYRMGFCYLGPLEESTHGSYDLVGTVNTGAASDYIPSMGIVSGVCDLRKVGNNKKARLDTELSPSSFEADIQFSIGLGQLSNGEIGFDYPINSQITQVPRFCKLTIEVSESANGERPTDVDLNEAQFTLQIDQNLR